MKTMHICLLTPSFLPVVDGGVPISSGRAAESLLRAGHRVTALTVAMPDAALDSGAFASYCGFTLHHCLMADPLCEPTAVAALCRWVAGQHAQQPFDVILAYFIYPSGYLGTILGQHLGLPVVCSCRGSDISTGVFDAPEVVTTVIARSTWMIFVSQFLLQMADALVPCRGKATVVPNAVDSAAFSPLLPLLRRPPPLVVGTCGLLRWKKGLDLWLPLIRTLSTDPDVHILLAGHGLYDADEQQITDYLNRYRLQERVERTGPLPHSEIVHALRRMDIYVNTSYQEGMPNGVLEAMACGLPVVATDAGDTPDVVDHGVTGYICPKGDLDAMVAYCRNLIEQPTLRQCMGRSARQRVEQVFYLDRESEAIEAILRQVCQADRSHKEVGDDGVGF